MQDFKKLDHYLRKEIDGVAGYLTTLDAETIASLGKFQTMNNIKGDLCEMGVHHGRLFFILCHLRQPSEKALPIDLFADGAGNDNDTHRNRDKMFFKHSDRMGIKVDDVVIGNTLELKIDDILKHIGKTRIVSVDAGHLYDDVDNDLKLAAGILSDDGVIIADDYFNMYWPDVTTATNDFLRHNERDFAPFLITGKLYICRRDKLPLYRKFAEQIQRTPYVTSRLVDLNKEKIVAARMSRRGELKHKVRKWF